MDTREIAKLACRLLALYFAAMTLTLLPGLFPALFSSDDAVFFATWSAVNLLVYTGVSFCLWRYAEYIASRLVPDPSDMDIGSLSFRDVQRLAFSVVGLVFAVQGVAGLFQTAAFGFTELGSAWERSVSNTVKFALGLFLLIGSDKVMGILGRLEQNRVPQNDVENS